MSLQSSDRAPLIALRGVTKTYFAGRPMLILRGAEEKKLRNGMTLTAPPELSPGDLRVYGENGEFLALCRCDGGRLITIKSFFKV